MEMLGYCEVRRGHAEEAFQLFQRALQLAPSSPMANYFVGAHYEELGHREQAILHYGVYLANDDGDAFRLKYARKHLGRLTGSRSPADWNQTVGVLLAVLQQELADGTFGIDGEQSEAVAAALATAQQNVSAQQSDGVTPDELWKMYEAIRQETDLD
jgi:tetratricopeptide (TPR) repeat protein